MPKKESATVLIVDNDDILANLVAEQISLYGFQPILASSGEEALELARGQSQIDILLTDIMMPKMNGIDLAKQFISLYPDTRVIFMSGFFCPSMAHYRIQNSEHGFVQKPFTRKKIIAKIRAVLAGPVMDF